MMIYIPSKNEHTAQQHAEALNSLNTAEHMGWPGHQEDARLVEVRSRPRCVPASL